jgi:hypothetical protein
MPIIDWVLGQLPHIASDGFIPSFADPRSLRTSGDDHDPPLTRNVRAAVNLFPCDVLFVHRDAELLPWDRRIEEIHQHVMRVVGTYVPIVPVRMTEAWLLISSNAIRKAADNPNGRIPLDLPRIPRLDQLPDPKSTLNELLARASEKRGRRLDKLKRPSELAWRRYRVAQLIGDFAPLRAITAFQRFEETTREVLTSL